MQIMLQHLMSHATNAGTAPKQHFKAMADLFNEAEPGHDCKHPALLFQNLYKRVVDTGDWVDRPRTGAPPKLSDEQALKCCVYFKKGRDGVSFNRKKKWRGYRSIEQAARLCPVIIDTLKQTGVCVATLWKRMKEVQLREFGCCFKKIHIRVKPALKKDVKRERLSKAKIWQTWDMGKFACIFWIDEKHEYMAHTGYSCYGPDDAESYCVESHDVLGRAKKIKYIACVNGMIGPVYFALVSGTSGFDSGFMVRTHIPAL
jgi:hypothetical protein